MSGSHLAEFGMVLASEVLSALSIPGSSVLSKVVADLAEEKRRRATNLLIEEIKDGHHGKIMFDDHDIEPFVEISYRFWKAASDGAAMDNLRLLAQIIAGMKARGSLNPDRFLRWSSAIEALSADEVLLLGHAYLALGDAEVGSELKDDDGGFFQRLQQSMRTQGKTPRETFALCASVSRTGLLIPISGFDGGLYGAGPDLRELGTLAKLKT